MLDDRARELEPFSQSESGVLISDREEAFDCTCDRADGMAEC